MIQIQKFSLWAFSDFLPEINDLYTELHQGKRKGSVTLENFLKTLDDKEFHLFVAVDVDSGRKKIVGMGTIFIKQKPEEWIGEIHDMAVIGPMQKQGIGGKIVDALLVCAKYHARYVKSEIELSLTSNSSRTAAHKLYLKKGFRLVATSYGVDGTNLYKKTITP